MKFFLCKIYILKEHFWLFTFMYLHLSTFVWLLYLYMYIYSICKEYENVISVIEKVKKEKDVKGIYQFHLLHFVCIPTFY